MIRVLLLMLTMSAILQPAQPIGQPQNSELKERLTKLEKFLAYQFDDPPGLVRESPDTSINRDYWLLSDNLIAMHILQDPILGLNYSEMAAQINQTMHGYGIFTDGLHEALFGDVIQLPPYAPIVRVVENSSFLVRVEVRSNETGDFLADWVKYADVLIYGALSEYNAHDYELAIYYLNRALEMWNGAGLWDLPTQQDGFYTTHKLALLMYAAEKLNQTIPYQAQLEARIWQFQREDGGIRSHYLGNLTSNREANSETAGLILLAYQFEAQKESNLARLGADARVRLVQELTIGVLAALAFGAAILTAKRHYARRAKKH